MKFYRFETVEYATIGMDGEFESPSIPNPKLELRIFDLYKETPKGYWIGDGNVIPGNLRSSAIWVSKSSSKKRYAYPTEKEALNYFIKKSERKISILKRQIWSCEISLREAIVKFKEQ